MVKQIIPTMASKIKCNERPGERKLAKQSDRKISSEKTEKKKANLADILVKQLYLLIDDIREIVPSDKQGTWLIVKNFFSLLDNVTIIQHVISHVLPYKKEILEKNEDFFINNTSIFGTLPESEVEYFRIIIGKEGKMDQQDKDKIWNYFEIFIVIAEEYKKNL